MGRRRLLVPEAKEALNTMKQNVVAQHQGDSAAQNMASARIDKGQWLTKQAGEKGGAIGGEMVARLVQAAKEQLMHAKGDV